MVPHTPSNTIDFDAAKLQRLGYASRGQRLLKPVSLAQLRHSSAYSCRRRWKSIASLACSSRKCSVWCR